MRFTSEQDTYNWALEFAKELKVGDKVALYGNLGAGKTVISRGICKGLGTEEFSSDTFQKKCLLSGRVSLFLEEPEQATKKIAKHK